MADAIPPDLATLTALEAEYVRQRARGVGVGDAALAAGYKHKESGYDTEKRADVRKALDLEFEHVRLSSGPEAGLVCTS